MDDDTSFSCWRCSSLVADPFNQQFICKQGLILFGAGEPMKGEVFCNGTQRDEKRKSITGKTTYLYRLLCIYPIMVLNSLPSDLIGCVGNLSKYKIIASEQAMVKAKYPYGDYITTEKQKIISLLMSHIASLGDDM